LPAPKEAPHLADEQIQQGQTFQDTRCPTSRPGPLPAGRMEPRTEILKLPLLPESPGSVLLLLPSYAFPILLYLDIRMSSRLFLQSFCLQECLQGGRMSADSGQQALPQGMGHLQAPPPRPFVPPPDPPGDALRRVPDPSV
jgi:hypothetical protein